jgi:hypothetical protein
MHCARCAIPRFLLAPQALTASSRSIWNATVANEINAENREGPKNARKGKSGAGGRAGAARSARSIGEIRIHPIVSAIHILADLTLGLGRVVHDYLRKPTRQGLRINEMALAT